MTTEQQTIRVNVHAGLRWKPMADWPTAEFPQWMWRNAVVLRALGMLESNAEWETDATDAQQRQIERLEAKIDVALSMIAQLLSAQGSWPHAQSCQLYAKGLTTLTQHKLEQGSRGVVELYLDHRLPQPLLLPATVGSCQPHESGHLRVSFDWQGLDEHVTEWLERTIFRLHRREIQMQRALK